MKNYIEHDEWCVIERGFHHEFNKISESIFSLGNGRMGHRANFEEKYSGETLLGNYVAGVYYPDKTRVGWWKNGYPEYFAKVLNAPNWGGIDVEVDGEILDLATCQVLDFQRVLNMKDGFLERSFTAITPKGKTLKVNSKRFCSIVDDEAAAIRYSITPVDFSGILTITAYVDADIQNEDANFDEKFWIEIDKKVKRRSGYVLVETKKTEFQVCTGMKFYVTQNEKNVEFESARVKTEKYISCSSDFKCKQGEATVIYKFGANISSENYPKDKLAKRCEKVLKAVFEKGFDKMLAEQAAAWHSKWQASDIQIEGDVAAQQGIRFNIFQLNQTYTGEDERLNIGPKGFTGEKYGGSTYWDTEAYCLPFYLVNAEPRVARNLLIYRYKQLQKAIENAQKLGFTGGAALYPMVTMNGEECHNEWEITFEEVHRNGAIAHAIFDYINYTGDQSYLGEFGLEVLIAIARFWSQRVHWSAQRKQYVMHGVTGPNEYENNINNNWYTNYIARWCMEYAAQSIEYVRQTDPERLEKIIEFTNFNTVTELEKWKSICEQIFLPEDKELGIFLQQDSYLDKDILTVADLRAEDRPLNQKWSWDRILRSCFIKQADVLQGLCTFESNFSVETIRKNFDFYEPRTVHESSLSPCVHVIVACKIENFEKAYEMYLRTSRLDLDDYNNDTEDGCHITSMAGTWMSVVRGFGGMRVKNGALHFSPNLPKQWTSMAFKVRFRGQSLEVKVSKIGILLTNLGENSIDTYIFDQKHTVKSVPVLVT